MPRFEHHYTFEQAQAAIPWIQSIFSKIHRLVQMIQNPNAKPLSPGKSPLGSWEPTLFGATDEERRKLIEGLLGAMVEKGIVIQDIHRGLLDFPSWRGDQEILLCYELSDGDHIQYWHDLDSGFAGRQEIDAGDFS